MALPAEKRLKLAGDFRAVFRNQQNCKEGRLLLKARPTNRQYSRFGIVISKEVAKKAVDRNRMRRLLADALFLKQDSLKTPHDIVLIALPGFSLDSLNEATQYIEKLLRKASLNPAP